MEDDIILEEDNMRNTDFDIPMLDSEGEHTSANIYHDGNNKHRRTLGNGTTLNLRGTKFRVPDLSNEKELEGLVYDMSTNLYEDSQKQSVSTRRKYGMFRFMNVFFIFSIVVMGALIGILTIHKENDDHTDPMIYTASALGFLVTAIEIFNGAFKPEKRSLKLKEVSVRQKALAREVARIEMSNKISTEEKLDILSKMYSDLDNLELSSYEADVTLTTNVSKPFRYSKSCPEESKSLKQRLTEKMSSPLKKEDEGRLKVESAV